LSLNSFKSLSMSFVNNTHRVFASPLAGHSYQGIVEPDPTAFLGLLDVAFHGGVDAIVSAKMIEPDVTQAG